jgi:hypothetical protein
LGANVNSTLFDDAIQVVLFGWSVLSSQDMGRARTDEPPACLPREYDNPSHDAPQAKTAKHMLPYRMRPTS